MTRQSTFSTFVAFDSHQTNCQIRLKYFRIRNEKHEEQRHLAAVARGDFGAMF